MLEWLKGVGNSMRASWSRFRNNTFMEATMAGSALVASADGVIQDEEKAAVGGVIGGLEALKDFDGVKLFACFETACALLKDKPFVAKGELFKKIAYLKGKKDGSPEACLQVVIAVADASDGIDDKEAAVIRQIASTLGVDAEPFLPKK